MIFPALISVTLGSHVRDCEDCGRSCNIPLPHCILLTITNVGSRIGNENENSNEGSYWEATGWAARP